MKVLFVLRSFTTHDRQNALCVESIVKEMLSMQDNLEVDYVSWEYKQDISENDVYTVFIPERTDLISKYTSGLYKFFHIPIGRKKAVDQLYKRISQLISKTKYDAIIAVINPPETAEAVCKIKRKYPELQFILYEIDPNSNRYKEALSLFQKYWKRKSIHWEKKVYETADIIVHMETHRKHFSQAAFSTFFDKTVFLDIPCFSPTGLRTMPRRGDAPLRLIYGGAFYPDLREPFYMVDLFRELCSTINLSLDIYTGQSMRKELLHLSNESSFIDLHDEVSEEVLDREISKSDILVSVGNKCSDFLPSKTLKYMSTGKPIIHFFSDETDVSLNYYKYYPAILLVDQRKPIDHSIKSNAISFIRRALDGFEFDYPSIAEKLEKNTPGYSAKKLLELINE